MNYLWKGFIFNLIFLPVWLFSQPVVTAPLVGQFGNQLFIMAAAISLALDHQAVYTFPDLATSKDFNIPFNYQKVFYHLNAFKPSERIVYQYREPSFTYQPIPYIPNMAIKGFFQSEKYFIQHKQEIIDLFSPPPEIVDFLTLKYGEIIRHPQTVSVHMRSYLNEPYQGSRLAYVYLGGEYVEKAMALFPEDSLFIVFSNDMEWCKKELNHISRPMVFIEGESYHHDFYLMSLCRHNIICNSSFSWWAAYLNRNPDKVVVAPAHWFTKHCPHDTRDLIPREWMVLK